MQTDRSREAVAQAFATHLRALRLRSGLSQAELAGPRLSRAGVAKLEAGVSSPSLATLGHLASVLDLPLKRLIPPRL
jgi:transcriptional regulator with XRE-family HTH domain